MVNQMNSLISVVLLPWVGALHANCNTVKKLIWTFAGIAIFLASLLASRAVRTDMGWLLFFFVCTAFALSCYAQFYLYKKKLTDMKFELGQLELALRQLTLGFISSTLLAILVIGFYVLHNDVKFSAFRLGSNLVIYAFVFAFGAAVLEEILFRGLLQGVLKYLFPKSRHWLLVVVPVALLFAFLHKGNQAEILHAKVISAALSGFILGTMAYRTNALWLSIGAHLAWNSLQIVAFGHSQNRLEPQIGVFDQTTGINKYAAVGFLVVFTILIFNSRKKNERH